MKSLFTALFVAATLTTSAQESRVVLVGNTGKNTTERDNVLQAIKQTVEFDDKTTVLFLGDNFLSPDIEADLKAAISLVDKTKAKAIFLPGRDEWNDGEEGGYSLVKKRYELVKGLDKKNIMFLPKKGCPGPEEVELADDVILMAMDSQWWLHDGDKPGVESPCGQKNKEQILAEVESIIKDNDDKLIIFATHHPFRSTGVHSGYYGLKQHIFPLTDINKMKNFYLPLPIIGSLYPFTKNLFASRSDKKHPYYQRMVYYVDHVLEDHAFLIHVAGHEHQLELLDHEGMPYIVSGSAPYASRVSKSGEVAYADDVTGFTVLDISTDKTVDARFYAVNGQSVKQTYAKRLMDFSSLPLLAPDTITVDYTGRDSVVAAVNKKYANTNGFKNLIAGYNYRDVWAADVKMKVFDIDKDHGGFKIHHLGGGKQSKTLHLEGKDGEEWALRSLNKNIKEALPSPLRETFAQDIVQDMVSTANPYGILMMPKLSEATGVLHTDAEIVFVPNDEKLGAYRTVFANTVCMLEKKEPTLYGENAKGALSIFNEMVDDNDHVANQPMYLRARMLDFLIADFDRHYDQWKWGKMDTGKGATYYPIPKDRDQAFFYSDGLLHALVTWRRLIDLRGFKYTMRKSNWLGFAARDMDRFFLNELDKKEWQHVLDSFRTSLTDDVIEAAVQDLPEEIYRLRGYETASKLKVRRDLMAEKGMDYYEFLAKRVRVLGSNKAEIFDIYNSGKGMTVDVYDKDKDKQDGKGFKKYSRTFDDAETKEIHLYGLNGDDEFRVADNVQPGIKLRIVGGKGDDVFDIKGAARNIIYDDRSENNKIVSRRHTTNMISNRSDVNEYDFRRQFYNSVLMPRITGGFNRDDGFLLGLGVSKTTEGFRSEPYATRQDLSGMASFTRKAYKLNYEGIFNDVIRHWDFVLRGSIVNPTLNNFFGLGNETVRDDTKPIEYYFARYNYTKGDFLIRKRFATHDIFNISFGPTIYHYWAHPERNAQKVLEQPAVVGLDSASVYTPLTYAGGKLEVGLNYIDNPFFPGQGINWNTELVAMQGLNDASRPITKLISTVDMYSTLSDRAKLVAGLHMGAGHILSDNYEYFQALTLGANNYLRGYRKNRFAGSSMAYGSAELRGKLFNFNAYVLSGHVGLIGFGDIGRVWTKNDISNIWHTSYGGGIYISPFDVLMISAVAAVSDEETLINISFGTKFNMVF